VPHLPKSKKRSTMLFSKGSMGGGERPKKRKKKKKNGGGEGGGNSAREGHRAPLNFVGAPGKVGKQ